MKRVWVPLDKREKYTLTKWIVYAVVFYMIVLVFTYVVEIGVRSASVQAIVALAIIWATLESIERSDLQIEVAQMAFNATQEQADLLRQQLEHEKKMLDRNSKPTLIWSFEQILDSRGYKVINFGAYPIYIQSFELVVIDNDGNLTYEEYGGSYQNIIKPVEVAEFSIIRNDRISAISEYINNRHFNLEEPPEDIVPRIIGVLGVAITFKYGGAPEETFTRTRSIHVDLKQDWRGRFLEFEINDSPSTLEYLEARYEKVKAYWVRLQHPV